MPHLVLCTTPCVVVLSGTNVIAPQSVVPDAVIVDFHRQFLPLKPQGAKRGTPTTPRCTLKYRSTRLCNLNPRAFFVDAVTAGDSASTGATVSLQEDAAAATTTTAAAAAGEAVEVVEAASSCGCSGGLSRDSQGDGSSDSSSGDSSTSDTTITSSTSTSTSSTSNVHSSSSRGPAGSGPSAAESLESEAAAAATEAEAAAATVTTAGSCSNGAGAGGRDPHRGGRSCGAGDSGEEDMVFVEGGEFLFGTDRPYIVPVRFRVLFCCSR